MWSERNVVFDSNICRFCGSASKKLLSIQSDETSAVSNGDGNAVWQLIRRLVPLKIEPGDQKPQQVCCDCIATLEKYDAFISTCLSNDIAFDNILQSIKTDEAVGGDNAKNAWSEDGKIRVETEQADSIIVLNKANENANVVTENFYIIVELNCKGLNMQPVLLKCNENGKNVLSVDKMNEDAEKNDVIKDGSVGETCSDDKMKKDEKKSKPFSCTICNKSLTRKSNLISHLALHSKDRPHKCNECGKNFAVHADLTLHKHIHSKSYACDVCNKCFVTKSKLERHEKSHTGVKEHACPVCKKPFAEKNNMMAHISVHTGERPFSCSVCKKSFRTQSHLTDHSKVHSPESPFKCAICNKSFKWKSNLKDHNKFHSGEKFKCSDCNMEFGMRTDYYKHRKECRESRGSAPNLRTMS